MKLGLPGLRMTCVADLDLCAALANEAVASAKLDQLQAGRSVSPGCLLGFVHWCARYLDARREACGARA